MTPSGPAVPRLAVATAALAALVGLAVPSADAAPTTDDQGFVDSTARCSTPDTAAAYGSTSTSRVAICKSPSGAFEYRGVRIRDGAKLILAATRSGTGAFIATSDGTTYTLTSTSLIVSSGSNNIRTESLVDYHGPSTAGPSTAGPSTTGPSTASTATASTTPVPSAKPDAPTTKLPPPLPAEVGGGS